MSLLDEIKNMKFDFPAPVAEVDAPTTFSNGDPIDSFGVKDHNGNPLSLDRATGYINGVRVAPPDVEYHRLNRDKLHALKGEIQRQKDEVAWMEDQKMIRASQDLKRAEIDAKHAIAKEDADKARAEAQARVDNKAKEILAAKVTR